MKSDKGVTLSMLLIYIIILLMAIGILSIISEFFYRNEKHAVGSGEYISEFNKFNMYFLEDVKKNSNLYSIKDDQIIFDDGTTYIYKEEPDQGIYRNEVKICKNIEYCRFSRLDEYEEKIVINVKMVMKSSELFQTSTDYVLKYW